MRTLFRGLPRQTGMRVGLVSAAALLVSACSSDADRLSLFGVDDSQPAQQAQGYPVQPVVAAPAPTNGQPLTTPAPYTAPTYTAPGYTASVGTVQPAPMAQPQPLPQPVYQAPPQPVYQTATRQAVSAPNAHLAQTPNALVGAQMPRSTLIQPQPTYVAQPQMQAQPQPLVARPAPIQTQPLTTASVSAPQPLAPQPLATPVAVTPAPTALPAASAAAPRPMGWSGVGGTRVQVQPGETLFSISRRYGVPVQAIQDANGISDPGTVRAGQQLVIPVYSTAATGQIAAVDTTPTGTTPAVAPAQRTLRVPAPTPRPATLAARAPAPAATQVTAAATPRAATPAGVHVVATGDTAYNISRRYGMTVNQLATMNGLSDPGAIRLGQRLRVSGNAPATQVASTAPVLPQAAQPQQTPAQTVAARSYTQPQPVAEQTAAVEQTAAIRQVASRTQAAEPAAETPLQFRWPIRGRILSSFGTHANGVRNDGVNIAVPEGASIRAAEDGEVVYAGNELRGFGNLVLVQHRGGYVTAYAHNSRITVQRGDRVSRGEIIARAGSTGDVDTPQLHFEIRRGTTPVDPSPYLPQG
ncbi:MAG: peptidoglycan DD-metalloendopeptidase family protein [Devosiaceae bacterium]|nr:peptidoglycan DD-metalloendopeptidase family protein [Devosiaceae bacterium MH13]